MNVSAIRNTSLCDTKRALLPFDVQDTSFDNDASSSRSRLKKRWMNNQHQTNEIRLVMRTIYKDVLRTDRTFGFYADSNHGNVNVQSLFHILTTYCISHSNVTYCQGRCRCTQSIRFSLLYSFIFRHERLCLHPSLRHARRIVSLHLFLLNYEAHSS